jgi:hypothetical protein
MKKPPAQKTKTKSSVTLRQTKEKEHKSLMTTAKEQLAKYKPKEKRDSKLLAKTLIALWELDSKPGYGSFGKDIEKLNIARATAYRWMGLHGWKPPEDKRKRGSHAKLPKKPQRLNAEDARADVVRDSNDLLTRAVCYFTTVDRQKWENELNAFIENLRKKVTAEFVEFGKKPSEIGLGVAA